MNLDYVGDARSVYRPSRPSIDFLCPDCWAILERGDEGLHCRLCDNRYPVIEGIPDFVKRDVVWSYGRSDQQSSFVRLAREQGWRKAVAETYADPRQARWLTDLSRGSACLLTDIDVESRVLDVGCGWGTISLFLAEICREVYAIDITSTALQFLSLRAAQEGLEGVYPARVDLMTTNPFPEASFDLVVLNGVLEWVPDYHQGHPREIQRQFLQRCGVLLKPGGQLLLGIENRTGLHYLLGYPDEHTNLRWITLLPRGLAEGWSRFRRQKPYRTYTYTPMGLKRLVQSAGFTFLRMHYPLKSYREPTLILQCGDVDGLWRAVIDQLYRRGHFFFARFANVCTVMGLHHLTSLAFDYLFAPALYLIAERDI